MSKVAAITALHDPEGRFIPLLSKQKGSLLNILGEIYISHTKETDPKLLSRLGGLGYQLFAGGLWGESRRQALGEALLAKKSSYFFCDFDKILHWVSVASEELRFFLEQEPEEDFLILGRGSRAMATYPLSWQQTEGVVNRLVSRLVGRQLDVMAAVCRLSAKAGKLIYRSSVEEGWGSCVEWPLIAYKANLSVGYQEAEGLSWEDPDRFQAEIKIAGGLEEWKKVFYDSPQQWEKRFLSAAEQLAVVARMEPPSKS
jgi:hypothetical protein